MCTVRSLAIAAILIATAPWPGVARAQTPSSTLTSKLHGTRSDSSDLQISGQVPGIPTNEPRFLAAGDLLPLSQPMTISPDDGNFKISTKVRAIPLETLAAALAIAANEMIVADCTDHYQAHYSRAYVAAHHPVLVTELDGAPLREEKDGDYGPYMIAHEHFAPAFRILAHSDEPQIPWGVTGLQFQKAKSFLAPVTPQGPDAGRSARAGYQIAEQNCLRCHYNGTTGGSKSGVGWGLLTNLATHSPQFFAEYVRDPKARNARTRMPARPDYDDATMAALIAYFRTFAPESEKGPR